MDNSDSRIPEDLMPEVMAVASRLYAEQTQSYSVSDLMAAGAEVQIPPQLMQQALQQVQAQQKAERIKQKQAAARQRTLAYALGGVMVVVLLWGGFTYNVLASEAGNVEAAWAQVENQLQRRADLIPQLVQVTQASARHDQDIVAQLNQSRSQYLSAQNLEQQLTATVEMNRAIAAFQTFAIRDPQLQASQAFSNLQYEIAGTENRIATERRRYNQAVQLYNRHISSFPSGLVAGLLGFERQPFFQADNRDVPTLDF
ncbi:LemA family protein [Synechococcales cyanobacterium C]|uniref:LemA family protein n=1 Tax=Petrachloros mirabilis ULC683 TaxID=2781853 RepID=A0A8K1ZVR5_9CYAN|nr:LemA family protein [Petrachloros mirabilis]NCJ05007.1 LemA family protein [Petrachloros mirabilis ULC683]